MQKAKKDIKSMYLDELTKDINDMGQPSYRAKQIYAWLHKGVDSFECMTDISQETRALLEEHYYIAGVKIENKQISESDGTVKYLLRLGDNNFIESVVMNYNHGSCICISTQVGCKMGCKICATGLTGFLRNLTASEMLSQIQCAEKDLSVKISNVVLMGMGEPLDNYENVVRFIYLASSLEGMNIGMRHISVSTCGIIDKIYKLADLKLQITLSISLHAPDDKIRNKIMPVNNSNNIERLIEALRYYVKKTNRRICFEYVMIDGLNDDDLCAEKLARLLKGLLCYINVIPYNEVQGIGYTKSSNNRIHKFVGILLSKKIPCTIRRTLGYDIDASCGQLRRRYLKKGEGFVEYNQFD